MLPRKLPLSPYAFAPLASSLPGSAFCQPLRCSFLRHPLRTSRFLSPLPLQVDTVPTVLSPSSVQPPTAFSVSATDESNASSIPCVSDHGDAATAGANAGGAAEEVVPRRARRVVSLETRRKIAHAMVGVPKSAAMRAKLSASMKAAMKTRPPWNKGKTLSMETRERMSRARLGRTAWNKGLPMSEEHKRAISAARLGSNYSASPETKRRLRLARRRPGDAIVSGGSAARPPDAGFPLVETSEINAFVTLRRALRGWSDSFAERNGRRPSLADVRRTAPPPVVRDFEKYTVMRDRIRGLASDVYGDVNPADVPVVPPGNKATEPQNNNHGRTIIVTKHGNRRIGSEQEMAANLGGQGAGETAEERRVMASLGVESTKDDMWDAYDYPVRRPDRASGFGIDRTLFGAHELGDVHARGCREGLSMNDYRLIGKYRLMESKDICTFVQLRRELERWSKGFRNRTGRIPKLSDVKEGGEGGLYAKFCKYLDMRHSMSGLMKEVYGTNIDDLQTTLDQVNEAGKSMLDTLRLTRVKNGGND